MIRKVETWQDGGEPAIADHVELIAEDGNTSLVAVLPWIREKSVDRYMRKGYEVLVYEYRLPFNPYSVVMAARSQLGHPYGTRSLFLHLGDALFRTDYFTLRYSGERAKNCSQLTGYAFEQGAGITFNGTAWKSLTPDDMLDHVTTHPELWRKIGHYIDGKSLASILQAATQIESMVRG